MTRRRALPRVVAAEGDLVVERDERRPTGRLLLQGDMEASYVDLADPRHLEFDYMRRMRDVVELTGARRIVHVGGAACALARALAAAPGGRGLRQEVVEVDGVVLDLARRHLGLRRMPGVRVRRGDGRAVLAARPDASADALLVDAFVGARVPPHLVTAEALADVARVLAHDGVLAVNVVDVPPLADVRAIAAGLRGRFAVTAALGSGPVLRARRGGNVVLLAGRGGLPLERLRSLAAADPEPAILLGPAEVERLAAGAAPWRDAAVETTG
jgi:SAM-dependent methyltransferase